MRKTASFPASQDESRSSSSSSSAHPGAEYSRRIQFRALNRVLPPPEMGFIHFRRRMAAKTGKALAGIDDARTFSARHPYAFDAVPHAAPHHIVARERRSSRCHTQDDHLAGAFLVCPLRRKKAPRKRSVSFSDVEWNAKKNPPSTGV